MASKEGLGRWGSRFVLVGLLLTSSAVAEGQQAGDPGSAAAAPEGAAPTDAPGAGASEEDMAKAAFMTSLHPEAGKITLRDNLASLTIPEDFAYLNAAEAERVLTEAWGNPPGSEALGMIYPRATGLLEDTSWAVIVTYTEDGYVEDDDAEDIDYADLLKEMQEGTREANAERAKGGYPAMQLIGWAEPPHYDKASHKLYWAKELQVAGAPENTLNYAVRVLGRKGVLELNAIATLPQLPTIKTEMKKVMGFVEFNSGSRYEDFVGGADKVAAYGIGALVAGKVAAKVGLFKGLIALLIAGKKFLIFGAIALFAGIKSFLGRKKAAGLPAQLETAKADDPNGPSA
jgi:uncharacterized membrane-anchored protein